MSKHEVESTVPSEMIQPRGWPEYFATSNKHKFDEVRKILGTEDLKMIDIDLPESQSLDVAEVVAEKARAAYELTGKSVLVEDTGLECKAWNGKKGSLPGALIKWFMKTVGNEGIVRMMSPFRDRRAEATTAFGYADSTGSVHVFVGSISGQIPETVQDGPHGFGWDAIFIPDGYNESFAQLPPDQKNDISMRKLALDAMKTWIEAGAVQTKK